ncbi:MAG: hypothetical protein NTZ40_08795 [Cyanobacteria bacterium]|nr:hypothetical protein [Cyanobacteriota bacterium]
MSIVAGILPNDLCDGCAAAIITPVSGFTSAALASDVIQYFGPGCAMLSEELACFDSVTTKACFHIAMEIGAQHA